MKRFTSRLEDLLRPVEPVDFTPADLSTRAEIEAAESAFDQTD